MNDQTRDNYLAERQLQKGTAGWKLLAVLGISAVIAGHFAGWNYGIALGGWGGMFIALLLMATMYLCMSLALAELASMIPTAGGGYGFARRAFGPLAGFITGITIAFEYIFAAAAIAAFIGAYSETLIGFGGWPVYLLLYISVTSIHCFGVGEALKLLAILACFTAAGLIAFLVKAMPEVEVARLFDISPDLSLAGANELLPFGFQGILLAMPFAMTAFLAVESIPLASEEAYQPESNVPKGLTAAICILISFALLLAISTPGVGGAERMGRADAPLVEALTTLENSNDMLVSLVNVAALIGLCASFFSVIFAYSRQIFALSRAGYLPRFLSNTNKRKSPYLAIILPGLIGLLLTLADATEQLIVALMFCATLSYIVMMAAHYSLRTKEPNLHRPYKTPGGRLTSGIAILLASAAMLACVLVNSTLWSLVTIMLLTTFVLYFWFYSRHQLENLAPEENF